MAALSWLSEAIKPAESSAVTSRNQTEKAVLVTDSKEESLIDKGLAGFVTSVTSVTSEKRGSPQISADFKRLFSANDPAPDLTPRHGWLIHFSDREPVYVTCSPAATHAEVLQGIPDAVAAEPGKGVLCLAPAPEFGPPCLADSYDDRITCPQCENFTYSGICNVARPGGPVSAQKGYRPARPDMRQRCSGFESKPLERNSP